MDIEFEECGATLDGDDNYIKNMVEFLIVKPKERYIFVPDLDTVKIGDKIELGSILEIKQIPELQTYFNVAFGFSDEQKIEYNGEKVKVQYRRSKHLKNIFAPTKSKKIKTLVMA